jgi:hypothetical protein
MAVANLGIELPNRRSRRFSESGPTTMPGWRKARFAQKAGRATGESQRIDSFQACRKLPSESQLTSDKISYVN